MNQEEQVRSIRDRLAAKGALGLGVLWRKLEKFGKVRIHTSDDFTYSAFLKLANVTRGCESEFCSGFKHKSPEHALTALLRMVEEAQEKVEGGDE